MNLSLPLGHAARQERSSPRRFSSPSSTLTPSPGGVRRAPGALPAGDHGESLLEALRTPLAAGGALLSLLADAVPEACRSTLDELRRQHEHVARLCADGALLAELDAGAIVRRAAPLDLRWWLECMLVDLRERARPHGIELSLHTTSCVPGEVLADVERWQQALDGVLHVAMQRAQAGPIAVAVHYDDRIPAAPQLVFTVTARGGGFTPAELRDVFRPFAVRDPSLRPLLGLSVAHRVVAHIGGSLHVDSVGAVCSYVLSLVARPTEGAHWVDPRSEPGAQLGPVAGGSVLFVGRFDPLAGVTGASLVAGGYRVERARDLGAAEHLLRQCHDRYGAVFVDLREPRRGVGDFVRSVRRVGYGAPLLALVGPGSVPVAGIEGLDRVFDTAPPDDLVQELRRLRGLSGYNVRRNATRAS